MKEGLFSFGRWFIDRLRKIPERDPRSINWFIIIFFIATSICATIYALGNPIGPSFSSHAVNIIKMVVLNGLMYFVFTLIIAALFSFIYLPLPRLLLASFSYTICLSITLLIIESTGNVFAIMIGISYGFLTFLIAIIFVSLFYKKRRRLLKLSVLVTILVIFGFGYQLLADNGEEAVPVMADYREPVHDSNPAQPGNYKYKFLTYGSGKDVHREEFGSKVDISTPTVDASDFITKWSKEREKFWEFSPANLPINGRVWLPAGEGKFPLILMVHGNHTMEYFSTDGYDYLGELLASRGFIAVSVDEDFINYSNTYGAPNDNYKLRAWMMIQHLIQLQSMNDDPASIFYQKINFDQVGLVGHSRGGQAVLTVADYKTFFDDPELLKKMALVDVQGVVAIAPTDTRVDDKKPSIHNVSYLLLHGARDADVYNFRGDQQFYRASFDPNYDGFRATVYIADANHTQFNTSWGSMDLSLPRGLFLNQQQTMAPEDQQQIAKVYLSAFFERVFNDHRSYEKLFQDYRYGKDWLPETVYVTKYRPASYQGIKRFSNSEDDTITFEGFSTWEIERPQDRRGNNRLQYALKLEWNKHAVLSIDVTEQDFTNSDYLALTMANIHAEAEEGSVPEIEVELVTHDGISVTIPLAEFMPFPPVIKTDYTHFGLMDGVFRDGRYENSWEPIFQSFDLPLDDFEELYEEFSRENIAQIKLHFSNQPGKIYLEEIGVW